MQIGSVIVLHFFSHCISLILVFGISIALEFIYPNITVKYYYLFIIIALILGHLNKLIQNYFIELFYREWLNGRRWHNTILSARIYTIQEFNTIHLKNLKKKCIKNLDECRI
jgi:hypothetical protein